jgi:hypothetical protein
MGGLYRQAAGLVFTDQRLEMVVQLGFEFDVESLPPCEIDQTPPDHWSVSGSERNLAITETVSVQLAVSSAICLRPLAVSS